MDTSFKTRNFACVSLIPLQEDFYYLQFYAQLEKNAKQYCQRAETKEDAV
jgi:hypothetical protein